MEDKNIAEKNKIRSNDYYNQLKRASNRYIFILFYLSYRNRIQE